MGLWVLGATLCHPAPLDREDSKEERGRPSFLGLFPVSLCVASSGAVVEPVLNTTF